MPWNYAKWRAADRAARDGLTQGPWRAGGWYPLRPSLLESWRHFGPLGAVGLTIRETFTRTTRYVTTNSFLPDAEQDETRYLYEQSYEFDATVVPGDLWRGPLLDKPEDKSAWQHTSASAFGQGLYDAKGYLVLLGEKREKSKITVTSIPHDAPESSTVPSDTDITSPATVSMDYVSDFTAINGLATPCRLLVPQMLHGPSAAFQETYDFGSNTWSPVVFDPGELDPDGNPGTEVYWTDAALAALAGGAWESTMVLLTGSASGLLGPTPGGFNNGDFWTDNWSRSGELALTLA